MGDLRRHADRVSLRRVLAGVSLATALTAAVAAAAAAAVTLFVARSVITPPSKRAEEVEIVAVDRAASRIVLTAHPDSLQPGRYGLWFDGDAGHLKVGDVLGSTVAGVTRELIAVDHGDPRAGMRCRFSGWFYLDPSELNVPFSEVLIETPLGDAPAWLIPASGASERWVINVHGRGVDRRETIRAIPVFRDAGYTSLLVSYRNDGVAPASSDGYYSLGDTEWQDVDAAIAHAIENGAREIVLMGWSMGGATVLQAATRSAFASRIRGIVLDSPVIDWVRALDHQAAILRLPRSITWAVKKLISMPLGRYATGQRAAIDLKRLDFVTRADDLSLPILLLHSDGDRYVPNTASRMLAQARPDIVRFPVWTGAGHTRIWNYDSERWNSDIARWLVKFSDSRSG